MKRFTLDKNIYEQVVKATPGSSPFGIENLPTKICPVCKRSFTWRKKWKLNWERVKYCSKRCSSKKHELRKI